MKTVSQDCIIEKAVQHFEYVAKNIASHINVRDENIYPQPSTFLTTHYICMKVAGFDDIDFDTLTAVSGASALFFDTLTAVSGASALFAYFPNDFMPKYALLHIGISKRIEQATGFGWDWLNPSSPEECFEFIKESIDSGKPVKSTYFEDILFSGYSERDGNKRVYGMTDGADYFIHWFNWKTFSKWFSEWGDSGLGRFTGLKETMTPKEIAIRFLEDLVRWSEEPPQQVIEEYPGAKFGLEGIEQYAIDCGSMDKFSDWRACHDINPQWITRRSTSHYLKKIIDEQILDQVLDEYLLRSSTLYLDAYKSWREFYNLLGHPAPEKNGENKEIRMRGSNAVKNALILERKALSEISAGLKKLGETAS
jgi:hypothetical protein